MTTTTTRILAMSTVLNTRAVGLYLVYVTVFRYTFRPSAESARGSESVNTAVIRPTDELTTIPHVAVHHAVMGQSFGPQADSLIRHRDRYGAPERVASASRKQSDRSSHRGFYACLRGCAA